MALRTKAIFLGLPDYNIVDMALTQFSSIAGYYHGVWAATVKWLDGKKTTLLTITYYRSIRITYFII